MITIETIDKAALTPATIDAMLDIWESAVRATHDFLGEADIIRIRDQVRDALPLMEDCRTAMRDGEIVGFIACNGDKIEALFIHAACRGGGIGRMLAMDAIGRGAIRVDVNEDNEQGVGFYRRLGFTVDGRSEQDDFGNPFPLLHLVWRDNAATD